MDRMSVLVLELTHGCNSRCLGCDHRGPAGGETLDALRCGALAREARSMGARQVLLTGGEPLLRPHEPDPKAIMFGTYLL